MFLICHLTSRQHMFKRLCEFKSGCHLLPMSGSHWSSASRDIKYLIFPTTPQNHVTEGSCNFLSGSLHLAKFRDHKYHGSRDMMFLVCHVI